MADVPLLPVDEEKPVLKVAGSPSLGRDVVRGVSVSRRAGRDGVVDTVVLSGGWVELEGGEKLVEGVSVTVVYNSGVTVVVVPGISGDGWVGVRKVGGVDVSVTEAEVLSAIENVVEPRKVS